MSETEIARLNERVARAMGGAYIVEGREQDFYHDIRLCGEMMEWLRDYDVKVIAHGHKWEILVIKPPHCSAMDNYLPAALCRAIDAVAKGTP